LRRVVKADAGAAPFLDFRENIFRQKGDLRGPADQVMFCSALLRGRERQQRSPIRRRKHQPALARWAPDVERDGEPEAVFVELTAAFLVANKNSDGCKPQVGILAARLETATVRVVSGITAHRRDYIRTAQSLS